MKKLILFAVMVACSAWAATASAASIKLEVDTLGQQHDSIRIHMANIPRDFDFAAPPAYDGAAAEFQVDNLTQGQTYKFCARLVRGESVSPISNVVTYKVPVVLEFKAPVLIKIEKPAE